MDGIFYPRKMKSWFLPTEQTSRFTENFRVPYGSKLCPLCLTHLDNQQCPIILPSLGKGKYNELFASEMHLLNNLKPIEKIKNKKGK